MRYTGVGLVSMGAVIAAFAGAGAMLVRPDALGVTAFMLLVAAGSALAGAAALAFGGSGLRRLATAPT